MFVLLFTSLTKKKAFGTPTCFAQQSEYALQIYQKTVRRWASTFIGGPICVCFRQQLSTALVWFSAPYYTGICFSSIYACYLYPSLFKFILYVPTLDTLMSMVVIFWCFKTTGDFVPCSTNYNCQASYLPKCIVATCSMHVTTIFFYNVVYKLSSSSFILQVLMNHLSVVQGIISLAKSSLLQKIYCQSMWLVVCKMLDSVLRQLEMHRLLLKKYKDCFIHQGNMKLHPV